MRKTNLGNHRVSLYGDGSVNECPTQLNTTENRRG